MGRLHSGQRTSVTLDEPEQREPTPDEPGDASEPVTDEDGDGDEEEAS